MRDPKTEQYLNRGGFAHRFVEGYDLGRINLGAEAQNPARLARSKDADHILKMAVAMLDGVEFPAIVVFLNEAQPHDSLVTGYHRCCAAADARIGKLDAYVVVEHDPYRRALLPRSINSIEGKSSSQSEDLAQVAELLRLFPDANQQDLAVAFSLKPTTISDYLRLIEQEDRARRLGIDDIWRRIPQLTTRRALGRIQNDHSFVMAAQAVDQMHLVGKPAEDLVDAARKARTEAAAGKVLQDAMRNHIEVQERAKAKFGKRAKQTVSAKWFGALTRLWRILPVWDIKRLHLDGIEPSALTMNILKLKEVRSQIDDVIADQERRLVQMEEEAAWRTVAAIPGAPISADTSANA